MIACDAHMHTRFSEDSDASVHSMLDAAVKAIDSLSMVRK